MVAFQFHKRYWSSSRVATLAYAANQEQSWINNNNNSNKKNLCAIAIIIALPAHNQNIKQLTKAAQHSTTTLTPSLFISLGARLALLSITPSLALSLSLSFSLAHRPTNALSASEFSGAGAAAAMIVNGKEEEATAATVAAAATSAFAAPAHNIYICIYIYTHTVALSQCITKTIGWVRTPIGHNYWGKRNCIAVSNLRHMLHLLTTWLGLLWPACTFDLCFWTHRTYTHTLNEGARLDTAHACNGACVQRAYDKYTIWRASVRLHVV